MRAISAPLLPQAARSRSRSSSSSRSRSGSSSGIPQVHVSHPYPRSWRIPVRAIVLYGLLLLILLSLAYTFLLPTLAPRVATPPGVPTSTNVAAVAAMGTEQTQIQTQLQPQAPPPASAVASPLAAAFGSDASLRDPSINPSAVRGLTCGESDEDVGGLKSCVWSDSPAKPNCLGEHLAAIGQTALPLPRRHPLHVHLAWREEALFHHFGSSHRNLEAVLEYFAPTLKFDSREHYYPVNMSDYLRRCAVAFNGKRVLPADGSLSGSVLSRCHWRDPRDGSGQGQPYDTWHDWIGDDAYSDVRLNAVPAGYRTPFSLHCPWADEFLQGNLQRQPMDDVPLYAHARFAPGHEEAQAEGQERIMEIIYVATYAFNGPYSVGLWNTGEHQSDQEHLTVYVNVNTWTIKRVWMCTHGYRDGRWTSWGDLEWEDTHSAGADSDSSDVAQIPPPAVQFDERGVPVFPLPPPPRRFLTYVGMYYHGHNPHPSISDDFERENGRGVVWRPRKVVPLMQQPYWAHHETQWAYFSGALGISATNAPANQQWWEVEPAFLINIRQRVGFAAMCITVGLVLMGPFVALRWAWRRTQRHTTATTAGDRILRPASSSSSSPLPSIWTSPSRSFKLLRRVPFSRFDVLDVLCPPPSWALATRRCLQLSAVMWALVSLWLVTFLYFFFVTHSWVAVVNMAWDYLRYITRRR